MKSAKLISRMKELGIDIELSNEILAKLNDPNRTEPEAVKPKNIPGIDGTRIIDRRGSKPVLIDEGRFLSQAYRFGIPDEITAKVKVEDGMLILTPEILEKIGLYLMPLVSYGVLNGGSASSYADIKKNRGFSEEYLNICGKTFDAAAEKCQGKAKGITPAFIHPDGTPGPTFMELKMRAVLIQVLKYRKTFGETENLPLFPLFQMTSVLNDDQIARAYEDYKNSPLLKPLMDAAGIDVTDVKTGAQPLISAYTPALAGEKKETFSTAYGKTDEPLPFPGGHGQNFAVLASIYRELHAQGKKFLYLGNVDNLGNLPDPASVAILALTGKEAAFDFSFKTPIDVKGGILIEDQNGRLNCADMGVAIPKEEVAAHEAKGQPILFNCATGLFSLDHLIPMLDDIIENLPLRTSIQDKDPGRYAQTEQVTWEVIGMLEEFLIFGVDKYERFLASKLLLENLLTSGIGLAHPNFPRNKDPAKDLHRLGKVMNDGLNRMLKKSFGMELLGGKWEPVPVDRL